MKNVLLGTLIVFTSLTPFTSLSPIPSVAPAASTPVLVELFTSEGCSSCPPADRLLIDLIATQPVPAARIIALSEHVDYWNELGWVDPFSAKFFSQRQTTYGTGIGADVYTPQMVVDGRAAFVGSDRAAALAAIRAAASRPKAELRLVWTTASRQDLEIATTADPALAELPVLLAVTEDHLTSRVRRGENEGRELAHDAVTRRLTRLGATDRRGVFSRVVPIAPMLDPSWTSGALHIVVFVQGETGGVVAVQSIAR